jgi:CheY-like chemotaxis protein
MPPRVLVVDDSTTIRKVVERTLSRAGYDVALASDGQDGLEEAQRVPPDLVLVDFVMPRMNGFQMAMALRNVANLRHVPIVLMSARAEKIAGQFMSQTGAVDAINKPFSPEALLAVTAHALDRAPAALTTPGASPFDSPDDTTEAGSRPSAPPFGTAFDTGSFARVSSVPPAAERGSDPDVLRRLRAEGAVKAAGTLADGLISAIERATGVTVDSSVLTGALLADGSEAFVAMLAGASSKSPGTLGIVALEGRIEHVGLGDVLQLMQMQQQSGVLEIERGQRTAWISLRRGLVDLASARGVDPEFLLGRYLIEEELLEREDLDHLLRSRVEPPRTGGTRKLLGDQLVKLGYITAEDLQRALVRQTSELVYHVLRWSDGRYRFARFATRPEADAARLGLPIASVLMEGLRRVDEWRLIEEQIHSFDVVFERNGDVIASLDLDALSREERAVLSHVDGRRTVREIVEESRLGSFECCKALFQFATSRMVRRARNSGVQPDVARRRI